MIGKSRENKPAAAGVGGPDGGDVPARRRGLLARAAIRPAAGVVGRVGGVAAEAQKSRLPQMAAALAFRTIFGIIPVIVVALVGLKFFTTEEDIQHVLSQALRYTGLSEIVVNEFVDERPAPAAAAAPTAPRQAPPEGPPPGLDQWMLPLGRGVLPPMMLPQEYVAAFQAAASGANAGGAPPVGRLDQWIGALVTRVSAIPFRTIGVIGLAALIYAAISMLVEIERAFNQIYRVPIGRSWPRRITQYWTLLTLGMLMLFATFYVGDQFKSWAAALAQRGGLMDANDAFSVGAIGYAFTVLISTVLLLLAYTTVPNTRVRLRPALAGAFLAAVLWEAGKWGFTQYINFSANYAKLYGSLALLPLFLLWVYVTWVIVLLGLQVSYFIQFGRRQEAGGAPVPRDLPRTPAILDPAAGVAVIAAVARAFEDGRAMSTAELAAAAGAPEPVVQQIIARLSAHHLVHAVDHDESGPDGPDRFMLSRPASAISLTEVLEATYEAVDGPDPAAAGSPSMGGPAASIVARLRRAQIAELAGLTLAEAIGGVAGLARSLAPGSNSTPAPAPPRPTIGLAPADPEPSPVRTTEYVQPAGRPPPTLPPAG